MTDKGNKETLPDEFIDKMIQQGMMVIGTDFASKGDETAIMMVRIVDGEPVCERITEEEFYGWPIEVLGADELCERYPQAPIEMMEPPNIAEIAYTIKQAREDIDRIFYTPPKHRGHPVSPRKRRT